MDELVVYVCALPYHRELLTVSKRTRSQTEATKKEFPLKGFSSHFNKQGELRYVGDYISKAVHIYSDNASIHI